MIILTVSNCRVIVLRRFVNNMAYVAGQMYGAVATFKQKKTVMWSARANRPRATGPGIATVPPANCAKQQVPKVQQEIQPVPDDSLNAQTRQGQGASASSQAPVEAPNAKGGLGADVAAPAAAMLLLVELQNTQVCSCFIRVLVTF